jgi:hypothetical protein
MSFWRGFCWKCSAKGLGVSEIYSTNGIPNPSPTWTVPHIVLLFRCFVVSLFVRLLAIVAK